MKHLSRFVYVSASALAISLVWLTWQGRQAATSNPVSQKTGPNETGAPPPFSNGDGSTAASDPTTKVTHERVAASLPPLPSLPEITAAAPAIGEFRTWAVNYTKADAAAKPALLQEGVRLAQGHRSAIKTLIVADPRTAIEQAVPLVLRQRMPAEVVAQLEKRISGKGPLDVLAVSPDSDPSEPVIRRFATINGTEYRARVYGRRSAMKSAAQFTVNGVAVDAELAISESPVRPLEIGEVPDPAKQAVEVCPVSGESTAVTLAAHGALPVVTEASPAIEVGEEIIYLCNGGHITQVIEGILEGETTAAEGATGGPAPVTGSFPSTTTYSTGIRKILYMRAVFPDRRNEPQTEVGAYANVKTLTDYFMEQSYGKLTFSGTVTPTLMLPRTEAWYINNYNTTGSNNPIMNDAKEAARAAGFPPEDYQHFTLMYTGGPGGFGGLGSVGGSSAWLKQTSVGTFEHEIGHNLGVWHSNRWNTAGASVIGPGANVEYGHSQDVMGSSGSGGHFNASMKEQLKWVLPEQYHTVLQSGTYRLYQMDQPNQDPAKRYALKVAKDVDRDYWLEFRQKVSAHWWTGGVSVNWSPWGTGGDDVSKRGSNNGTQLLDMTPGSPDSLNDSPLIIGRTFSDAESGVYITPIGKGGTTPESMDVVVNVGSFPGNQAPTLTLTPSATSIVVGGTVNFTATATDPNGDTLAYYWEYGDKLSSYNGVSYSTNSSSTQSKSYSAAGYYLVQCTVSDMKGGSVEKSVIITVGAPATFTISGTIRNGGVPVSDVLVSNGGTAGTTLRWCYTDTDGNYTVTNLAAGGVTLTATKAGYTFAPSGFTNPVTVGPTQTGQNFAATVATTVSVAAVDAVAAETGDAATFRLTRTGSTAAALTVYTDISGSAIVTSDYNLSPASTASSPFEVFTIPIGSTTLDITVTPVNDTTQEGPETIVMALFSGDTYVPAGPQTATVTIDDNDTTKSRVNLVVASPETTEGSATPATFTISRTGDTSADLTVQFTVDATTGNATNGTDYTSIGTSATIPAGASEKVVNIATINDSAVEGMELVKLTLASNAAYILATSAPATIKINDDDINIVTLTATDGTATEAGDTGRFAMTRSGDTTQSLLVHYTVGGSGMHGVDYQALPGFVNFAPGVSSATVDVVPINDTHGEATQSVILQVRSSTLYQVGGTGNASVTITDDDLPVVAITSATAQAVEGTGNGSFTFVTTSSATGNFNVKYTVSGSATPGSDFTTLTGTAAIARNGSTPITVTVLNDSELENAESVVLTILPDPAYTQDLQSSAAITIRDDDAVNMVNVSSTSTTMSESTAGSLYFSRTGSTTSDLTVNYTVGGTATPDADYVALSGSAVIPAGVTFVYVPVPLPAVNDSLAEGTETIVVTIQSGLGATPSYGIETASTTLTITDDEAVSSSSVGFASAGVIKQEDAGAFTIDVTRTGNTSAAASVEYAVHSGTALGNGVDYSFPTGKLDFAPGQTSKSIPISITDDNIPEEVETVTLQLRNPYGASIAGGGGQTTILIMDNEPRVTIDATDAFAYESGDTAQFTVRRHGSTAAALAVPITVSGTATSGTDFTALPATVTIPAGASTYAFTLTPINNVSVEPVETVIVALGVSTNSKAVSQTTATAYIGDGQSNNPPFIQIISPRTSAPAIPSGVGLSIDSTVVDETAAGSLTLAWTKFSGPGTATFSASAQPDTDVTFSASGTYVMRLTVGDGTNTSTSDLTVTVGASNFPWTNTDIGSVGLAGSASEQYGVHTFNTGGTSIGSSSDSCFFRSRHLIGDGEIKARVRYIANTSSARAGVMMRESAATGARMINMLLTPIPTAQELIYYRGTTGGAASNVTTTGISPAWWVRLAKSGNSYTAYDSPDGISWTQRGTTQSLSMGNDVLVGLGVMSGSTTRFNPAIIDNVTIVGTPENTAPSINAGPNGSVGAGVALSLDGTLNDDALPSLPGATTVQWSQISGPGTTTFADATKVDTTATFPTGGTYILRLTAEDGEVRTFDEATITVTAMALTVTLAANDPTATEQGLTTGQFTVARSGSTASPLTVLFNRSGTATNGTDYAGIGTQVTIPSASSSTTVTITPLTDTLAEGDETVTLTLTADAAYTVGTPSSGTVTIKDIVADDWRKQQFGGNANNSAIAGDYADPNNNGLANLVEYALGLNPTATGGAGLPLLDSTSREYSLTFTRNLNAPDITLSVEWSSTLAPNSWSTNGVTLVPTPIDANLELIKASVPAGSAPGQKFLHIKVVR